MGQLPMFVLPDAPVRASAEEEALLRAIGRLICAWGRMECDLDRKIVAMRATAGDVRIVGSRTRPGMARMFAELRAIVSMRDKRGATALNEIAEIERTVQRLDRFRMLVIEGFTAADDDGFLVRDGKNMLVHISAEQLARDTAELESLGVRLMAL